LRIKSITLEHIFSNELNSQHSSVHLTDTFTISSRYPELQIKLTTLFVTSKVYNFIRTLISFRLQLNIANTYYIAHQR